MNNGYAPEAERMVLGSILLDNTSYYQIADKLGARDFADDRHAAIFEHVALRIPAGEVVDFVTINHLADDKRDQMGGISYVAGLIDGLGLTQTPSAMVHYARLIRRYSSLRQLRAIGLALEQTLADPEADPQDIAERLESDIAEAAKTGVESIRTAAEIENEVSVRLAASRAAGDSGRAIATGFSDFDVRCGGLRRGELVILGARPSTGKSALVGNMLDNMAGVARVGMFSPEMSRHEVFIRNLSKRTEINAFNLECGRFEHTPAFERESKDLSRRKFWIDDTATITIGQIRSRAKRAKLTWGLDVVIVDYLQLVRFVPQRNIRYERREVVAEVSHGLKALAKEMDVNVLAVAQLNREITEYQEPGLHNLRECGDIEQDADLVLFLWIDHDQHTLTVAKNRNGPRGAQIPLTFRPQYVAFDDHYPEELR